MQHYMQNLSIQLQIYELHILLLSDSCSVIWHFEPECQQALQEHLILERQSTGGINKAGGQGGSYLGIVADTTVRCGGHDLRCRRSQMAGAHDTGLGHPKAKDEIVPPQCHVTVTTARGARLLRIHRVTGELSEQTKAQKMLLDPCFWLYCNSQRISKSHFQSDFWWWWYLIQLKAEC